MPTPEKQAIPSYGRSRGGLITKIYALVDAEGRPIRLKLTEGQAPDSRSAADMLETVDAGHILIADRADDSEGLRAKWPSETHGRTSAPYRTASKPSHSADGSTDGATWSSGFSTNSKHFRATATRYDKRNDNFLASVQLASIRIWLRNYESLT